MRADQKARVAAAIEKGYYVIAGDAVTWVPKSGSQKTLLTIQYDLGFGEGLGVDNAGILNRGVRELIFLTSYLTAQGVTISPDGYFMINNVRWDFDENEPIQDAVVPIAGIHNLLVCRVRRAVEVAQTSSGTTWSWGTIPDDED